METEDETLQILKKNTEKAIKKQNDLTTIKGSFQFLDVDQVGPIYPKTICDHILTIEEIKEI